MEMELSDQELNQVSDVIAALDKHSFNEQISEALADLISTDDAEVEVISEDYRPEPARKQLAAI